jgi:hypothetical protein
MLDVSIHGPSRSGTFNGDVVWLYELQLAKPLLAVDLSRTPLSTVLSPARNAAVERVMHRVIPVLVRLNRLSLLGFGSILFLPAHWTRSWVPFVGAASVLPPICFSLFMSLEVLALLRRSYEFWFVSLLSVVNWLALGFVFGDARAVVCATYWLNSQIVVSIDACYRTYKSTVRSILMAGPSMVALVVCCSFGLIADASFPRPAVAGLTLRWRQVVVFTASNLVIFMFKKAFAKFHRRRARVHNTAPIPEESGQHVISCVVLRARMRLVPTASTKQQTTTPSPKQQLRLVSQDSIVVDARRTLLSVPQLKRCCNPLVQVTLYGVAAMGLASTATAWILVLCHANRFVLAASVVAVVFTLAFVMATAALAQRDLLRLLLWNFDVWFSAFQATALAFCLLDLLRWQGAAILAVLSWWLWFLWILILDAITPCVIDPLRLHKLGLPAILLVLSVASASAVAILTDDGTMYTPRKIFSMHLPKLGAYEEHTDAFAVQRSITIVAWNVRLAFELASCGSMHQLLFIRRKIEYPSPFPTFNDPLPEELQPQVLPLKPRPISVIPTS